ncbi:MAG: DUF2970 domain-containing protein [Betaproteobacteria bacterium]
MDDAVRKPSFLDTVKTVLAGAIGVRRKDAHERAALKPLHLVVAALIFVVLFIFTLLTIVRIVLS